MICYVDQECQVSSAICKTLSILCRQLILVFKDQNCIKVYKLELQYGWICHLLELSMAGSVIGRTCHWLDLCKNQEMSREDVERRYCAISMFVVYVALIF